MQFAIMAYHEEAKITALTAEEDAALMKDLFAAHEEIDRLGKLGPAARLDFVQSGKTLRGLDTVIDGPFAETKEALLGIYLIEAKDMDEALEAARILRRVNPTAVYEVRPVTVFLPGQKLG